MIYKKNLVNQNYYAIFFISIKNFLVFNNINEVISCYKKTIYIYRYFD